MRSLCIIYVLTSFTFIFNISDGAEQTPFDTNDSDDNENRPSFNFATQPEPSPVQRNRGEGNPTQSVGTFGMSTVTGNTLIGVLIVCFKVLYEFVHETVNLHPLPGVKTRTCNSFVSF